MIILWKCNLWPFSKLCFLDNLFQLVYLLWLVMSNSRFSGKFRNDCWYLLIAQYQAISRSSCRLCREFIIFNYRPLQTTKTVLWDLPKSLQGFLKVLHLLLLVIFQPEFLQAQDALIVRAFDSWIRYNTQNYRDSWQFVACLFR